MDRTTHTLTQDGDRISVQQSFMSLEAATRFAEVLRHIKVTATLPDDDAQPQSYQGRGLEIALAHQHDEAFAASAAILSVFQQLLSYEAELCYVPCNLVTSLPVSIGRLCVTASRNTLESQVGDLGRLVNLRSLELDAPRTTSTASTAEFRMMLEAVIPQGCELILHHT